MRDKLILQYGLFPFDQIEKGADIILYGDGDIMQDYSDQVISTNFCRILAIIDRRVPGKIRRQRLSSYTDTSVVVAAETDEICGAMVSELREAGFRADKIVMADRFLLKEPKLIRLENFSWNEYYAQAEGYAPEQFYTYINPHIKSENVRLGSVLDFGCGQGRMSRILAGVFERVICCDIDAQAVDYCRRRFTPHETNCRFTFIQNTQEEKAQENIPLPEGEIDFLLSWDTVVHFSYKWIDRYFSEFFRILKHGGYAMIHHANIGALTTYDASDIWILNQSGRSDTTAGDVEFIAEKHGFVVVSQKLIHGELEEMDCITILKKE